MLPAFQEKFSRQVITCLILEREVARFLVAEFLAIFCLELFDVFFVFGLLAFFCGRVACFFFGEKKEGKKS